MTLKSPPPKHPSEYSPEIVDALTPILAKLAPARVHDPFAGRGLRLGALCDRLGIAFTGTDLETWEGADPRVKLGDSSEASTYPAEDFVVVTSPVYLGNRISSDYVNGPTPWTKSNGRRAYGISLGRALHSRNLARQCRSAPAYYRGHAEAVKHWDRVVVLNVDAPIREGWLALLTSEGYAVREVKGVETRRYRGPANSEKRADYEVVIVAERA